MINKITQKRIDGAIMGPDIKGCFKLAKITPYRNKTWAKRPLYSATTSSFYLVVGSDGKHLFLFKFVQPN